MSERMNQNKSMKRVLAGACLVLTALTAAACTTDQPAATPTVTNQRNVKVEPIAKHSMGLPREQVADVSAAVQVGIVPESAGTVTEILKNNGSIVKKDEVIARIYPGAAALSVSSAQATLKSAERSLASAKLELAASRSQLERTINNYEKQLKEAVRSNNDDLYNTTKDSLESSKEQLTYLSTKSAVPAAESQLESAKLALEQAKITLASYNIKSPSNGTLAELDLVLGASVTPGTKIATVLDAKRVSIKAELSEESADLVKGKKVLSLYYADNPAEVRQVKVGYIPMVPSTTTRLYTLQLTADNKERFFTPGSRVQLQLTTEEEERVLAVPASSIVREGTESYVFLLKGDKALKRKVTLGRIHDIYQEVLEGVKAGEKLIVSGQHILKDGEKVTVQ